MSSPRTRRLLASVVESVFCRGQIPQSLATRFSDDLAVTLDAFSLASLSGNAELPRAQMALNWDEATYTANVQLTTAKNGVLENGWYDGIWSDEALPLATEHRTSFRFVLGDFDDDGAVSNQDIALFMDLLSGAATPPGVGPAVGDMNRDGVVNNQDINPFVGALTFGVRLPDPLAAPGQIATWALSDTSLRVNWTPAAEGTPDGYRAYRSSDGTNFQLVADLPEPALQPGGYFWDDAGLGQGTKYWYRVRPYTLAAGNGHTTDKSWSCTVLPAPTVNAIEGGDGLIRVVWTDNADNATAFRITVRRADDPREVVTEETVPADLLSGSGKERSWLISGLAPQQSYVVSVTALRQDGAVSSAASPAVDPVATGSAQSEPTESETYVAGFGVPTYAGVTWDITPDAAAGAWQNQTVMIDLAGLPRHIFTKMHLAIDASTTGDVAEGLTFTVTAGTHTAVMQRATDWPGTQAHWTLGDTPLADWVEHVGESMQIQITAEGFPTDGSGGSWSLHNFWLQTGLPVVSVVAEDALATEGADPADTGSFRFERSGPRVDVALPIRYELSGTAVNGVDYEQLSGRHVFAPQQTSSLVEVVMLEDDEVEPDEEIQVALQGNPTGLVSAGLGNAVAVVTGQAKIRAKGQIDEFAPAVVDMSSRPPGNMAELIVWRTDQRAFWVYEGGVPTPLGASPAVTNAELRIVDQSRIIATNELEVIFEWTGPVRQEGREWSYRIQLCDATQVRPAAPLWVIVKVF